jgi:RNA polymerase sigma-70 factor (ECF subfamily)
MKPLFRLGGRQLKQQLAELRPRLYRTALAWCGVPQQADDLVQECLSRALSKLDRLQDPKALRAWTFSILFNCYRDCCRGHRAEAEIGDVADDGQLTVEEALERAETIGRVRRAVARLSPGQREVLTLVDLEGFTYAEVAGILEIPMGTVMSRLNRARQGLRERLLVADQQMRPRVGYLERVK